MLPLWAVEPMVIAITIFDSVISPLFDMSQHVDLYQLEGGHVDRIGQLQVEDCPIRERISLLVDKKVRVLICGAISNFYRQSLHRVGIQVFPWTSGDAEAVLALLATRREELNTRTNPEVEQRYPAMVPAMGPDLEAQVATDSDTCRCLIMLPGEGYHWYVHPLPLAGGQRNSVATVQTMARTGARVLLARRCCPTVLGLLAVAGIDVLLGVNGSVRAVARQYASGKMSWERYSQSISGGTVPDIAY